MGRLGGRQWGLVALVASTPFVFALVLAAAAPGLLPHVLGTPMGGASWGLAALLGLLGGVLFASCLSLLSPPEASLRSRVRYTLGMAGSALVSVGLCVVPSLCLMLAGPALSVHLERGAVSARPQQLRLRSPQELAEQVRHHLPRRLPNLPRVNW